MYRKCPKCGYERQASDAAPADQCPACGLLFEKWLKHRFRQPEDEAPMSRPVGRRVREGLRLLPALLLEYPAAQERFVLVARGVLLLLLAVWGWQFLAMDHRQLSGGLPQINSSFLHGVNLVFHEAGHILFIPFGDFLTVLGGSLMQLMVPAVVVGAFLYRRDPFAAAVGWWWLGQSLMDLAPYIHDARRGEMILLGGVTGQDRPGYHDWSNLLGRTGLLEYDHTLAAFVNGLGVLVLLSALVWGGVVIWRNWR